MTRTRLVILRPNQSLPSRSAEADRGHAGGIGHPRKNRGDGPRGPTATPLLFLAAKNDELRTAQNPYADVPGLGFHCPRATAASPISRATACAKRGAVWNKLKVKWRAALVRAYRWAMAPTPGGIRNEPTMGFLRSRPRTRGAIVDSAFCKVHRGRRPSSRAYPRCRWRVCWRDTCGPTRRRIAITSPSIPCGELMTSQDVYAPPAKQDGFDGLHQPRRAEPRLWICRGLSKR